MRKQKTIKMTASPLDPSLGGSFQPPATHDGDISIVFRGKNMSIHGWDGSAWSTIYTRNGDDKQFAFPHTYQNYYVKSLTGSDETFSASFFSTGKYERSTPLLAGIQRGTKLHDIEEVPIYTASDANKLLTVMSDGSLRWLGLSESYVVEVIGGGGDAGNTSGLEDLAELQLFGGATMNNGVLSLSADGDAATLSHSESYEIREAKTISMWMKRDPFTGSTTSFLGKTLVNKAITYSATSIEGWSLQLLKDQNTSTNVTNYLKNNGWHTNGMLRWIASNTASTHGVDSSSFWKLPYAIDDGEWHHIVFQIDDVAIGTQPKSRMFVDGNLLTEGVSCRNNGSTIVQIGADGWLLNRFHVGQSTSARDLQFGRFMIEGETTAGFFGGDLDGVNIDSGIKTDSEISDMFNAGRVIPAAPVVPTGVGTFLEELPMNTPWFGVGENSTVDNGILTSRRGTAFVSNGNMPQIDLNATEAVFSMWYNPVSTKLGLYSNSGNPTGRNFSIMQMSTTRLRIYSQIANAVNIDLATPITLNEWHHIVVTVSSNIAYSSSSTKSLTLKIYLDGQEVWSRTGNSTIPVRRNSNDGNHHLGSLNYNGNISDTGTAQFDFVEWVDNVTLTDAQILSMYNNGERGWSVADAAAS